VVHHLCMRLCMQVKLMRQLQEEAQKSRQSEQRNRKAIAQLQKQQRAKESKIQSLEAEKNKKEVILKRKMEEVRCVRKTRKLSDKVTLTTLTTSFPSVNANFDL